MFEGKTVIVTGIGRGKTLGYGIAAAFARGNANVAVVGRGASKLKAAARELETLGGSVLPLPVDGVDEQGIAAAVERVVERFGGVDVLVNCGQAAKSGVFFHELSRADLELAFETGPLAAFLWIRACYPHLKAAQGSVVNIVSYAGLQGQPGQAPLAAAKGALSALGAVAANEWAAEGVRVNDLCALVRTTQFEQWAKEFPQAYEAMQAELPEGGLATLEQAGECCMEIAASTQTGKTYLVTGAGARML